MIVRLFLLLTVVPLVELWLLVVIARHTSILATIVGVIAMGAAGTWLARQQGLRVWQRLHAELSAGKAPADSLVDGLLILIASVLLIAPGVLTDAVGVLLLLPPTRRLARGWLKRWFQSHAVVQTSASGWSAATEFWERPRERDKVIDVKVLDRE